jgi:biotin carboxylase
LHHHQLYEFMRDVPGPWLLKPRGEAGAMGIKQINTYDDLWRWLEQLGDEQSNFLLEEFIIGDVYHVDSIVWDGEVIFAAPHQYGKPPIQVAHQGGVFMSRSLDPESNVGRALIVQNAAVLEALGMRQGVAHTEFIRSEVDGKYYFVETAGRVGGASISDLIEQASGINLWAEWCRLELAALQGVEYQLPTVREGYAGILVCLARQQYPDMSSYDDPEVVWRMQKEHHAGVIVRSDDPERVEALLERYAIRFGEDFLAVAPPLDKPPT